MAVKKHTTEADVENILASIREIIAEDEEIEIKTKAQKPEEPKGPPPHKKAKAPKPEPKKKAPKVKAKPAKPKAKAKPKPKPKARPAPKPKEAAPVEEDVLVLTELAPEEEGPKGEATEAPEVPLKTLEENTRAAVEDEMADFEIDTAEMDAAMEDLVRGMLKEMIKEYLDNHLAEIIKKVAAEEVQKLKKRS